MLHYQPPPMEKEMKTAPTLLPCQTKKPHVAVESQRKEAASLWRMYIRGGGKSYRLAHPPKSQGPVASRWRTS